MPLVHSVALVGETRVLAQGSVKLRTQRIVLGLQPSWFEPWCSSGWVEDTAAGRSIGAVHATIETLAGRKRLLIPRRKPKTEVGVRFSEAGGRVHVRVCTQKIFLKSRIRRLSIPNSAIRSYRIDRRIWHITSIHGTDSTQWQRNST
ncbi:MAG: hypothetical protein LT106_09960 [Burkholderiaceae bacterium]|nr:hypothetical protein [Burkholderiaceae bacterium]